MDKAPHEASLSLHPDIKDFLVINEGHRTNPVVAEHMKRIPQKFAKIIPDFLICDNGAGLFLSLNFSQAKPRYLATRIREIDTCGHVYLNKILVISVDTHGFYEPLRTAQITAYTNDWTVIVGWSASEVGRIIETAYELSKSIAIESISGPRERIDARLRLQQVLKQIPKVSKTDAENLIQTFGSFSNLLGTDKNQLQDIPGLGDTKIKQLSKALHESLYRA
eukprot:GHVH01005001.1.p1 GENE.GHVH01005001.1~~GHVH01005001.1.p1  ORF type:complete len:222 (+),score=20.92 GHVH01005001.1:282-947(+)